MPLSEHEQRLLDQIEQALYAEDPKFAANVRSVRRRGSGRRWIPVTIAGVLVGLVVVMVGLTAKLPVLGVVGFVLILASCAYAASQLGRRASSAPMAGPTTSKLTPPRSTGIRSRMEDRLRRRFDER